jgi:hypothetical protein
MTHTPTTPRPQNGALAVRPLTAEVRSETDPNQVYLVTLPHCPCRDFFYRRGNLTDVLCKHLKAAMGLVGTVGTGDTSRLDEATAGELLTGLGITARTADAALARSREHVQGTVTLPGEAGTVVILYDRRNDFYDVRLPA